MCLVRALTALNRNGHAGTCHEQSHDGEEGRARSTGKRQLGDVLHVLHGGVASAVSFSDGVTCLRASGLKVTLPSLLMVTSKVTLKFWA